MKKTFLLVALLTSGLITQAQDLCPDPTPNANERITIAELGDRTEYTKYFESGQIKERGSTATASATEPSPSTASLATY